jgi:hypothetical protein
VIIGDPTTIFEVRIGGGPSPATTGVNALERINAPAQCFANSCGNFDRKRLRRSALTSTVTGNVPLSFLS